MNPFTESFKGSSNLELFRVLENQSKYQREAVEAAELEIKDRELTEDEISEIRLVLSNEISQKIKRKNKKAEIRDRFEFLAGFAIDSLNPVQNSSPTIQKSLRLLVVVFGLICIVRWYNDFGIVQFLFKNGVDDIDLSIIEILIPLVFLPLGLALFGLKFRLGWIIMSFYLTYAALSTIVLIVISWNIEPIEDLLFESLFPQASIISYFLTILFYCVSLWFICKEEIRNLYRINYSIALSTIGISFVLVTLFFMMLLQS